ncbi:MAG: SDR family oxidoreductase [Clostridia bacterium]|nr:SDR family oxidoreductase [Clostridia bacterium]
MRVTTIKGVNISALSLGTVQLGLNYGINNQNGKPDLAASCRILDTAMEYGINTPDTAMAYGDSEEVIGKWLAAKPESECPFIVTKVAGLDFSSLDALRGRHAASYYGQYGIRINAVCPGGLQSERTNPLFAEQYSLHTQVGRLANGDDIKGTILLLASDASAYLTGLSIPVDGGYTCI